MPGSPPSSTSEPGHDAAAEHAIELVDAGRQPRVLIDVSMSAYSCARRRRRPARSDVAAGRAPPASAGALLDERVPRAALGAAAQPLRRLRAAFLADEDGLGRFH